MASQLKHWLAVWYVGTFISTLARKNEKLARFWDVGTQARWHVNHAGTQVRWYVGTYGTSFSKLLKLSRKWTNLIDG